MATATTNEEPKVQEKDQKNNIVDDLLTNQVSKLTLASNDTDTTPLIICDAGYGLPSEARPRKEKILAITKQLYNFLEWQMKSSHAGITQKTLARVQVIGGKDVVTCLQDRLQQLWGSTLPCHVEFLSQGLETVAASYDNKLVYLSPDATEPLDPSKRPPSIVVVGLLIDRRIQPGRSKKRAEALNIEMARWPLEEFTNINMYEPLNVDTVMEGMQDWLWNCDRSNHVESGKECFLQAAMNAIERHARRHPGRPLHKPIK